MEVKIQKDWGAALRPEFDKPYFAALVSRVRADYHAGAVYPPGPQIFAAFNLTAPQDVKVVIVGQDPYHGPGQANGLAFSVNEGVPFPPSLRNIFKEISDETGAPIPTDGNLERWARQGVLLLNSSLTVKAHTPRSHAGMGWEQLTDAAIRHINDTCSGVVFLLWGADAIKKASMIDRARHLVLTSPHPSPLSAHRGFFGNRHFITANEYMLNKGKTPIDW